MADLSRYKSVAEGVARLLHPIAEVVLHDIEESRIVAIYNSFSKRSRGDDSLIRDREGLEREPDVHGPFKKNDAGQRWLKYVSVKLRDDEGRAIGLMCINLDLSVFADFKQSMLPLLATLEDSSQLDSLFDDDWQERITTFVNEHLQGLNRSLGSLTRQERAELVHELHAAGAFRTKNAPMFVANVLGVSRATIYNDLGDREGTAAERPVGAGD